jgi:hypothetical protein
MDALMDLIKDFKAVKAAGKADSELATTQNFQRKLQFLSGFRRGGKFDRLPSAAGGGKNSRRVGGFFPEGSDPAA